MVRLLKKTATVRKRLSTPNERTVGNKKWFDPFPLVHGTLPEKMVYAELSRRGIPFYFLNDLTINIPDLEFVKDYQADFIIPHLKLVIEVQGAFWHTKEKTIESDAYKFALYEIMGYRVLPWWDFDIIDHLQELFISEPSLLGSTVTATGYNSSELSPLKRTKVDTSKGIRTLNSRRKRGKVPREGRRKLRKAKSSYAT